MRYLLALLLTVTAAIARADTTTTNFGFILPSIGSLNWGSKTSDWMIKIDTGVPGLLLNNTFTGAQVFNGNVSLGTTATGRKLNIDTGATNYISSFSAVGQTLQTYADAGGVYIFSGGSTLGAGGAYLGLNNSAGLANQTASIGFGGTGVFTVHGAGAAVLTSSLTISGTPVTGTPAKNTLYGDTIVKAYAVVNTTAAAASLTRGFNIASVVYNGVGDITVNFSNAFTDAFFDCWCNSAVTSGGGSTYCMEVGPGFSGDSSSSRRFTINGGGTSTPAESKRISIGCIGPQ